MGRGTKHLLLSCYNEKEIFKPIFVSIHTLIIDYFSARIRNLDTDMHMEDSSGVTVGATLDVDHDINVMLTYKSLLLFDK